MKKSFLVTLAIGFISFEVFAIDFTQKNLCFRPKSTSFIEEYCRQGISGDAALTASSYRNKMPDRDTANSYQDSQYDLSLAGYYRPSKAIQMGISLGAAEGLSGYHRYDSSKAVSFEVKPRVIGKVGRNLHLGASLGAGHYEEDYQIAFSDQRRTGELNYIKPSIGALYTFTSFDIGLDYTHGYSQDDESVTLSSPNVWSLFGSKLFMERYLLGMSLQHRRFKIDDVETKPSFKALMSLDMMMTNQFRMGLGLAQSTSSFKEEVDLRPENLGSTTVIMNADFSLSKTYLIGGQIQYEQLEGQKGDRKIKADQTSFSIRTSLSI